MTSNKPIRHGEVLLLPVSRIPAGTRRAVRSSIVGHSETGHNHVLESSDTFWEIITNSGDLFVELPAPTPLRHHKTYDQHQELQVPSGMYKVMGKNEYDPMSQTVYKHQD